MAEGGEPITMVLHPVQGLEVLGDYQSAGFRTPTYLVRRPDGQVVHVSALVHQLLLAVHEAVAKGEPCDTATVATRLTASYGEEVSPGNVSYLVERKLRPAGLIRTIAGAGAPVPGTAPDASVPVANALLALRLRRALLPARLHDPISRALARLFAVPVVVLALLSLAALDGWLLIAARDEVFEAFQRLIRQPALVLALTALTIASAIFHELGHAAAAHRGGAKPGALGVGIYLVWPVFYTDVSDTYRLDRRGRLRTDLGGVFFNVLFVLGAWAVYRLTGSTPLLAFVLIGQIETLRQFVPFVRLDGYYVVSDLAGVPNLFAYLRPVLATLTRRRDDPARRRATAILADLHPRARRIITAWVLVTAPVLLVNVAIVLVIAPRLAASAWVAVRVHGHSLQAGLGDGNAVLVVSSALAIALLALPIAGLGYVAARVTGNIARWAAQQIRRRPALAGPLAAVAVAAVVAQCVATWPGTFRDTAARTERAIAPRTPTAMPTGAMAPVEPAPAGGHTRSPAPAPTTSGSDPTDAPAPPPPSTTPPPTTPAGAHGQAAPPIPAAAAAPAAVYVTAQAPAAAAPRG